MYLRILKKDFMRKRTMNTILLLFIILASMFIASSANNLLSVMTAIDDYFEMANVPDYWFSAMDEAVMEQFGVFADENGYIYEYIKGISIISNEVMVDGVPLEYNGNLILATLDGPLKVFDSEGKEITQVGEGEIYITSSIYFGDQNSFKTGSKIEISANGVTKVFTLKDYTKDALYGSGMIGMTRFLINENDFDLFRTEDAVMGYDGLVYTEDEDYYEKFYDQELNCLFDASGDMLTMMYIMDWLIAAVILVVSICLILISMTILRFTINFTMQEEYREIGVMKAIGLKSEDIRRLYIVKYFAIAILGATVGFFLSIPFGKMLLRDVAQNIMITGNNGILTNFICSILTAAIVMLFSKSCTGKVKKLSPIDAIRNGQSGERFSVKRGLRLGKTGLKPALFLAANDILSGMRRFVTMIIIFTIGLLLIIIPINTINTLQSDRLITWFNMAECHHVIPIELSDYLGGERDIREEMDKKLADVRNTLKENGIDAEVFQEEVFRPTITYQGKKNTSLAFQGMGDITDDRYTYLQGTPPEQAGEIAITGPVAEEIGAGIGDTVEITSSNHTQSYVITALFQSMNNFGEGIRYYHEEELAQEAASNCFGIQIRYRDDPDEQTLEERRELLQEIFPEKEIFTAGEYIGEMIGNPAGQLNNVKTLIILVVLGINILVTVLMVKSFLAKEKGEIGLLKSVGFGNITLVSWQSVRIGIVLLIAVILAVLLSTPMSHLTIEPIFQMMGAQSIAFQVNPLEVFFLYPLLVFAVTVSAGLLTALQVRKVKPSETSNIE